MIGANELGLEKLKILLTHNPAVDVTVVSTYFSDEFIGLFEKYPNIQFNKRLYENTDLEGKQFLILTTKNIAFNKEVKLEANNKGVFIEVLNQPELSDFYLNKLNECDLMKSVLVENDTKLQLENTVGNETDKGHLNNPLVAAKKKYDTSLIVRNIALLFFVFFIYL